MLMGSSLSFMKLFWIFQRSPIFFLQPPLYAHKVHRKDKTDQNKMEKKNVKVYNNYEK